jgi:hypothetical protein
LERRIWTQRVWSRVEPSIEGYSKLIDVLLGMITTEQIKGVAEALNGDEHLDDGDE